MYKITTWISKHCLFGVSCRPDVPPNPSQIVMSAFDQCVHLILFQLRIYMFQKSSTEKNQSTPKCGFVLAGTHVVLCLLNV